MKAVLLFALCLLCLAGCTRMAPHVVVYLRPDSTLIGTQAVVVDATRDTVVIRYPALSAFHDWGGGSGLASRADRVIR
jgi:hypothetical protein